MSVRFLSVIVGVLVGATGSAAWGDGPRTPSVSAPGMASACTALRVLQWPVRDYLGCSPDQPPSPQALRMCRVSEVSVPKGSSHGRRITTFTWTGTGRLERTELDGNVDSFEYKGDQLAAIRTETRDQTLARATDEVTISVQPRSKGGLGPQKRYTLKSGEVATIEERLVPTSAPEVVTLVRQDGRLVEGTSTRFAGRVTWDKRGRPVRWAQTMKEDGRANVLELEFDKQDRVVRMTPKHLNENGNLFYYLVEYACTDAPPPVTHKGEVMFCRGAKDCAGGRRCVAARKDGERAYTYCTSEVNEHIHRVIP